MRFKVRYLLIFPALILSFTLLGQGNGNNGNGDILSGFTHHQIDAKNLAKVPAGKVISGVKGNNWNSLRSNFKSEQCYQSFLSKFGIVPGDKEFFDRNFIFMEFGDVIKSGNVDFPDYEIEMNVVGKDGQDAGTIEFTSEYDAGSQQYLISSAQGSVNTSLLSVDPVIASLADKDNFPAACEKKDPNGFTYVKLRNRKDASSNEQESQNLGETLPFEEITPTEEALNSDIAFQTEFEKLVDDNQAPDLGYVISVQDLINYELKDDNDDDVHLFNTINDVSTTFEIRDDQGTLVEYPLGVFLDKAWHRAVFIGTNADASEPIKVKTGFSKLRAVQVLQDYVYILDEATNLIYIYQLEIDGDDFTITGVSTTNFGMDLSDAKDLAGFVTSNELVLYVGNVNSKGIYRLVLDKNTGLLKSGFTNNKIAITTYVDGNGSTVGVGNYVRLETTPRVGGTNNILAIDRKGNKVVSFSNDALQATPVLTQMASTKFELPLYLPENVGYNLGENAFFVVDKRGSKIHAFSPEGFYVGSTGQRGKGEQNNELDLPMTVSSNIFSNTVNGFVVGNRWSMTTGLKNFIPIPVITQLCVVEKAANSAANIDQENLSFNFSLSSGNYVDKITLKLNGQNVKVLNSSNTAFYSGRYTNEILVSDLSNLNTGWNTYTVELRVVLPTNQVITKTESFDFYYLPSLYKTNYTVSAQPSADLQHSVSDPLIVYKNMFFTSTAPDIETFVVFKDGKTILREGCVIYVDKPVNFTTEHEIFEFTCGSNLQLDMQKEIPKLLFESTFDGTNTNFNMVSCIGDHTGGQGIGGAQSSYLEIIGSEFTNYYGKAVYIYSGRGSVVDSEFDPNKESGTSLTSVGISVNCNSRLDIRGGEFRNNDIAVDMNGSRLYVGHHSHIYESRPVGRPLFDNNVIGIHSNGTLTHIIESDFDNNRYAIFDLAGELDMANNRDVHFNNNEVAVYFSNIAFMQQGRNKFVDNGIDIMYQVPAGNLASVEFKYTCNYWSHNGVEGNPEIVVETGSATLPSAENFFFFNTTPYLVKKGNGSNGNGNNGNGNNGNNGNNGSGQGGQYTCTGKEGNMNTNFSVDLPHSTNSVNSHYYTLFDYHKSYEQLYLNMIKGNFGVQDLYSISSASFPYTLTNYGSGSFLDESMNKNLAYTYCVKNPDLPDVLLEPGLTEGDMYIQMTIDRINALDNLQNGSNSILMQNLANVDDITAYPNPTSDIINVAVNVPLNGFYTLEIFNNRGMLVQTVFTQANTNNGLNHYTIDVSGLKSGMYVGRFYSADYSVDYSFKFVKNNGK